MLVFTIVSAIICTICFAIYQAGGCFGAVAAIIGGILAFVTLGGVAFAGYELLIGESVADTLCFRIPFGVKDCR